MQTNTEYIFWLSLSVCVHLIWLGYIETYIMSYTMEYVMLRVDKKETCKRTHMVHANEHYIYK